MTKLAAIAGKSVFVTGHTGFKGSWLCLWLKELGARVTGLALAPPTDPANFVISDVEPVLDRHHVADIRDEAAMMAALEEAKPDLVLHLAAQTVVREAYQNPRENFDVNVMGTVSVLEAVRKLDRPCAVVCVTSDKCYDNVEQVWGYRENDPMGPPEPYGASKGAAELVVRSYRDSFFPADRIGAHGIKLASARAGNVIGGGDWTQHALLTDMMRSFQAKEPVALRFPGAYRPWQHVLEALSGYLTLSAALLSSDDPRYCAGWNFGPVPGNEIRVSDLAEKFTEHWGEGGWIDASDADNPPEAHVLRLAIDKALWELDWRPVWQVDEVLERTAAWFRRYHTGETDMQAVCLEQIRAYQAALP